MRKIPHRPPVRYEVFDLPLFNWSATRDVPFTTGGRWVHRRTGLPPTVANLLAELAGLGPQARR
jgi:hypothetical protein